MKAHPTEEPKQLPYVAINSSEKIKRLRLVINHGMIETIYSQIAASTISENLKESLRTFIDFTKLSSDEFNLNCDAFDNDFILTKDLEAQIQCIENRLSNEKLDLQAAALSDHPNNLHQRIFRHIEKQCGEIKSKLSQYSQQPTNKEDMLDDWHEHKLRFEQQVLNEAPHAQLFSQALESIKTRSRSKYSSRLPQHIFICYAWPEEKATWEKHEQWIQSFLTNLRQHLHQAGFNGVQLDIKDNPPGGNIIKYMEGAKNADYVLLIGTRSLLSKHRQGTSAVCIELTEIRRRRRIEAPEKQYRVFPLLLSGSFDESFPADNELYNSVQDWKGVKSYYAHLKSLINALLNNLPEKAFQDIWEKFELECGQHKLSIVNGLLEQSVRAKLQDEIRLAAEQLTATEKSERQLLNIEDSSSQSVLSQAIQSSHISDLMKEHYAVYTSITPLFFTEPQPVDQLYINLMMVREREQRNKEKEALQHAGDEDTEESQAFTNSAHEDSRITCYENIYSSHENERISVEHIFDAHKNLGDLTLGQHADPKKILIVGRPGIGKSTFCHYAVHRWANGLWKDRFSMVIWVPLRVLRTYPQDELTLADVIRKECLPELNRDASINHEINSLLNDETLQNKILFILDGYDEVASIYDEKDDDQHLSKRARLLHQLIGGNNHPFILTSRPSYFQSLQTIFNSASGRRLETIGFSNEDIDAYVNNHFKRRNCHILGQNLLKYFKKNRYLEGMAHIPINLELTCCIWEDISKSSSVNKRKKSTHDLVTTATMTQLYEGALLWILRRHLSRTTGEDTAGVDYLLEDFEENQSYTGTLQFLQAIAWKNETDFEGDVLIKGDDFKDTLDSLNINNINRNPFIKAAKDLGIWLSIGGTSSLWNDEYYFIHLTFQEFFAARYWVQLYSSDNQDSIQQANKIFKAYQYNPRFELIWVFTAGILKSKKPTLITQFFQLFTTGSQDVIGHRHVMLLIRCLEECGPLPDEQQERVLYEIITDKITAMSKNIIVKGVYLESNHLIESFKICSKVYGHPRIMGFLLQEINNGLSDTDRLRRKNICEFIGKVGLINDGLLTSLMKYAESPNLQIKKLGFQTILQLHSGSISPATAKNWIDLLLRLIPDLSFTGSNTEFINKPHLTHILEMISEELKKDFIQGLLRITDGKVATPASSLGTPYHIQVICSLNLKLIPEEFRARVIDSALNEANSRDKSPFVLNALYNDRLFDDLRNHTVEKLVTALEAEEATRHHDSLEKVSKNLRLLSYELLSDTLKTRIVDSLLRHLLGRNEHNRPTALYLLGTINYKLLPPETNARIINSLKTKLETKHEFNKLMKLNWDCISTFSPEIGALIGTGLLKWSSFPDNSRCLLLNAIFLHSYNVLTPQLRVEIIGHMLLHFSKACKASHKYCFESFGHLDIMLLNEHQKSHVFQLLLSAIREKNSDALWGAAEAFGQLNLASLSEETRSELMMTFLDLYQNKKTSTENRLAYIKAINNILLFNNDANLLKLFVEKIILINIDGNIASEIIKSLSEPLLIKTLEEEVKSIGLCRLLYQYCHYHNLALFLNKADNEIQYVSIRGKNISLKLKRNIFTEFERFISTGILKSKPAQKTHSFHLSSSPHRIAFANQTDDDLADRADKLFQYSK